MFKKLLSNLPFNPSLIGQVSFYSRRLRQESSIRRLGVAFMVLSFGVQLFAAMSPSEPSLAASDNDILRGGFRNISEAVNYCENDTQDFKKILGHFGISCTNVERAGITYLARGAHEGRLYSMGRHRSSAGGDITVDVAGTAASLYMGPTSRRWRSPGFQALSLENQHGVRYYILMDCGNLVSIGPPTPPPPPPAPPPPPPAPTRVIACSNLTMSLANGTIVKPGTAISFNGQSIARHVDRNESVSMYYQMIDKTTGRRVQQQEAQGVAFEDDGPDGTRLANDRTPRVFNVTDEGKYQFKLIVQYDSSTKDALFNGENRCQKEITAENNDVCPDVPGDQTDSSQCRVCEENEDGEEVCLVLSKKARNESQNIDATRRRARPGDIITYTLSTRNSSNETLDNYAIHEDVSDILEYADFTDLGGGSLETINGIQRIAWAPMDIAPNQEIEKQLTIKVKKKLPETNTPVADPDSFDLIMTNIYGNTVNIELPPTVPKRTEKVATALPNTGPGETLAVAFIVTVGAGYFFARTRLMSKELDIVRSEYAAQGGNA